MCISIVMRTQNTFHYSMCKRIYSRHPCSAIINFVIKLEPSCSKTTQFVVILPKNNRKKQHLGSICNFIVRVVITKITTSYCGFSAIKTVWECDTHFHDYLLSSLYLQCFEYEQAFVVKHINILSCENSHITAQCEVLFEVAPRLTLRNKNGMKNPFAFFFLFSLSALGRPSRRCSSWLKIESITNY